MKKILWNIAFALVVLAFSTTNAWCLPTGGPGGLGGSAPDAASTSAMLGIAAVGFAAVRKYLR